MSLLRVADFRVSQEPSLLMNEAQRGLHGRRLPIRWTQLDYFYRAVRTRCGSAVRPTNTPIVLRDGIHHPPVSPPVQVDPVREEESTDRMAAAEDRIDVHAHRHLRVPDLCVAPGTLNTDGIVDPEHG